MDEISERVIQGLASHKLVPFFGAGVSAVQLGVDWKAVVDSMADQIALPSDQRGDFLAVAEKFQTAVGAHGFADFLRAYLIRDVFDDEAAWAHLFLLSLNTGVLYTTNQDNLFELASQKYGRPHRIIARVADLAETSPKDDILIKYHGDLERPETVIFTDSSYRDRIGDKRHFLNIRLQSDLLSKGFLFVGYSFSDINIRKLFEELREAFDRLPPSYLIAYHYDDRLENLNKEFGVKIIDPRSHVKDAGSDSEAFTRYLKMLSEGVVAKKHEGEVSRLIAPDVPSSARIATIFEVEAVEAAVRDRPFAEAIRIYRSTFDRTLAPAGFTTRIADIYAALCDGAQSDEDLFALHGAMFNMALPGEESMISISAFMVAINRCSKEQGFPSFLVTCPAMPSEVLASGTMLAIATLRDKGIKVTQQFRRHAEHGMGAFKKLPDNLQQSGRALIEWAWRDGGSQLPPHVLDNAGPFKAPLFEEIMAKLMESMPRGRRM